MNELAAPLASVASACGACGATAVVQWRRRPTAAELAAVVAVEEQRRADALAMADPQQPAPTFGPLPTAADTVVALHACAAHGIPPAGASRVHQAACSAPAVAHGCDCSPEPVPAGDLFAASPTPTLPTGW